MNRWFRHYAGMMRDEKLVRVAVKASQPVERVIWVWGAILESASEVNDGGRYDFDAAEAAYFLRCDVADVSGILDGLEDSGRIDKGVVVRWGDRQFDSDSSKERQRRYREKRNPQRHDGGGDRNNAHDTTSRDGEVTRQETESETEPPYSPPRGKELVEAFARFKAAYPKRLGNNPWEPARQKFEAAVKAGADPMQIVDGARRYAEEQAKIGKVGSEFIMQAKAWLNQKCWQDYPDVGIPASDLMIPKADERWPFLKARWDRERQPFNCAYVDKWPFPAAWLREAMWRAVPASDEWMETDLPAGMDRRKQHGEAA